MSSQLETQQNEASITNTITKHFFRSTGVFANNLLVLSTNGGGRTVEPRVKSLGYRYVN
jgi:hypothetical protein